MFKTHVHNILDIQVEKILKENSKSKTKSSTIIHVHNIIDRYSRIKNQLVFPST